MVWVLRTRIANGNVATMSKSPTVTNEKHTDALAQVSKPVSAYDKASRMQMAIRWFRHKMAGRGEGSIRDMIEEALEEESGETADISDEEKNLLKNMIHFGELTVRDIMIPRADIMALERSTSADELNKKVIDIGHTRLPVYDDSLDKIDGFIHVKDLFPYLVSGKAFEISTVLREILFVPPSMRIVDLLLKMRVSGCHMAIVVDEYGGTAGLVTMEDLFEELVGEIQDEHDELGVDTMLRWIGEHTLEADARITIERLEEALKEKLRGPEEEEADYDTLGGLVFSMLGRVPVKGEVVNLHNRFKIEVLSADPRRIRLVRVVRLDAGNVAG